MTLKKLQGARDRQISKALISKTGTQLNILRHCQQLDVNRNRWTPIPRKWTKEELEIGLGMDKLHMKRPYYGPRRIHGELAVLGWQLSRGRVRSLMKRMGLIAIYPKPRTSIKFRENKVYPYLLRSLVIDRPTQSWRADIVYIPMPSGFAYLIAIMDWHSRAVLLWEISNMMGGGPVGLRTPLLSSSTSPRNPNPYFDDHPA